MGEMAKSFRDGGGQIYHTEEDLEAIRASNAVLQDA